ncbi:ABC transporter ATP-binding protein [Lactiplantibacillus mudanjiangensis]|uniref:Multidrug resistance ABC transporter ATP-binding and permease protein n=1 Tax=Lactiplantibacillus mudanjiangensis TaxID=1296538 RepID=A0A660E4G9_9LACO|nr:ABC transporter ATP-binding protein [Lactiplantibacillus mudanjiangensis]VDG20198.1 Lipid A export ATP-binding/permease protein MsbA [Lactobacillus zymae] [Lactiplantibacillus mudanjiangensis]VDG24111.1 Lipid A export ATP-binding/permease protein MsbA [Lactobacillus zymae] [Lactiplantibacillus mudanjiangensis]VDG30288.1 Lipid A export ATP-binding/permease protein MsbA [Lactobacillus zymae] [Lactiplantibacillus mudanjiangensis]
MERRMSAPRSAASAKRSKFDLRGFLHLIRQTKPRYWQLWIGLILGMIATGAQLIVPKFAQTLINGFSHGINQTLLWAVIGLFVASAVISALSGTLLGIFGENVVANLRQTLWQKLVRLKVSYFDDVKTGEMTSRLVNDTTQIKDLLANSFPQMITSLLQLFGALAIMLLMDWKMTAIMFIAVPLLLLLMLPIMNQSSKVGRQRQDALAKFSGETDETLSEIRLVKSSNAEAYETTTGFGQIKALYQIGLKEAIYDSVAGPIMTAGMLALFVGVLVYAAARVAAGTMTMGTLVSFLMYLFQIVGPAGTLAQFFTTLSKANGSTERVRDLLKEPEEALDSGHTQSVTDQTLAMSHVDFAYDDGQNVLQDVNFEAKPNTVVAFAGPSGGGKSTIFGLLERYYQPSTGQVTIGGQNVADLNLSDWRSQIGYVSQDSAIMAGTIRHNLTYGFDRDFSDDELWHALQLASADQFVKAMTDGLDTQVGERGVKVSGGQRQRLAIARAFLRDPKILMLDEATASLDSESEAMVQKALSELMKGRTTLVIAHRLSTIVDADQIYFVENGHVSGHGTHQELMDQLPLYRDYVKIQFKE